MAKPPDKLSIPDPTVELELAVEEAISACGGNPRDAVKALIILSSHLEDQLAQVSYGYARGRVGFPEAG